jgi:hypothetical protein
VSSRGRQAGIPATVLAGPQPNQEFFGGLKRFIKKHQQEYEINPAQDFKAFLE